MQLFEFIKSHKYSNCFYVTGLNKKRILTAGTQLNYFDDGDMNQ